MNFRNYLAGTIFVVVLVLGPVGQSNLTQIFFLIILPVIIWLLLGWIWNHWQPGQKVETTLIRILSASICLALLVLAVLEATSKTHMGNTQSIRTNDGMEDVGDYVVLKGPDWGHVFILTFIALLILGVGVLKKSDKPQNRRTTKQS